MKKFKKYMFLAVLAVSTFSCDDYLDVNDNPNAVQQDNIRPDQMLAGALVRTYRIQARDMTMLGNYFMNNHYADVNNYGAVNENPEYNLNINPNFNSGIWDGLYLGVANYQAMIDYNSDNFDNHKAVALIMKSFYLQFIVDLYGDAPYSEAFKGNDNLTPSYDDDALIYKELVANVNEAIDLINNTDGDDVLLGAEDVVFGGDTDSWLAFANTVKMKLLLRQSGLASEQTYIQDEFDIIAASGIAPISATINPGYTAATDAQMNPYNNMFYTVSAPRALLNYLRASGYIADFLNGDVNGVIDPRRAVLYELIAGRVEGMYQGDIPAPGTEPPLSKFNPVFANATDDGFITTDAEVYFMLSEAAERGYLTSFGDAQTNFENGVQASFAQYGASGAALYLTAANAVPGLGWNGDHIQAIMTQKWLATNGLNPIEAYIDMSRTGFPVIPLASTAQYSNKPYRLPYPTSEYTGNSSNVPSIPQAELFSASSQYVPFWKN